MQDLDLGDLQQKYPYRIFQQEMIAFISNEVAGTLVNVSVLGRTPELTDSGGFAPTQRRRRV